MLACCSVVPASSANPPAINMLERGILLLRLAMPYQNSDIVDEALDEFFVLVGLTIEGELTLCPNFLARDFDFKLVFFRCLTYT